MSWNIHLFFRLFLSFISTLVLFGKVVASDCYRTTTYEYKGHQQTTANGKACVRWDSFDHKYRDPEKVPYPTGSEDENYCRDPDKDGCIWCYTGTHSSSAWDYCGIEKCVLADVNRCGQLSIGKPTVLGRNVTFTFIPDIYDASATIEWYRRHRDNPWSILPNRYKFTQYVEDGAYFLVLTDTVSPNDEVLYQIHYNNDSVRCRMETKQLELTNIPEDTCGFVYLRTAKVVEGENLVIEYYPSKRVLDNPGEYERTWLRFRGQDKATINMLNGVYEEENMTNDKYVLTIFVISDRTAGQYGVYCGQAEQYSNWVSVIVQVPPSAPTFNGLQDIEDCKGCIVGEDAEQFSVHCMTGGGTEPVIVTMSIGNESLNAKRYNRTTGGYIAFFYLYNRHHNAVVTCTVMNDALTSPFKVTARVYVIKSPTFQSFTVPGVLQEGDIVSITCTVDDGRPVPNLILNISGTEVSSAVQKDYFNSITSSYTSVVSLTTFERIWNKENITCCRYNKWYSITSECFLPKQVNYMFRPSRINLEVKVEEELPLQMYAVCTVYDSNPSCRVTFTLTSEIIASVRYTKNESQPHGAWNSEYAVNLNVSKDDNGKGIKCAADCPGFTVDLSDTRSIVLPYPPIIEFNISGSVLDIFKGEQIQVKCSAQSIPASNISWVEQTKDGNITKKQCHLRAECNIDINAHLTSQRHFICQIHYLESITEKHLTINILDKDQQSSNDKENSASDDKSFIWIILGSCLSVLLVVFIVCLVARKQLRNTKAKQEANEVRFSAGTDGDRNEKSELEHPPHGNSNNATEETYSQPDKTNAASPSDDATYSVVDKTGNSNSAISSKETKQVESGQMLYADLEFDSTSPSSKGAIAMRRNTTTEYVAIDFVKTAPERANDSETLEAENIYANQ